jgi:hypothetical protein
LNLVNHVGTPWLVSNCFAQLRAQQFSIYSQDNITAWLFKLARWLIDEVIPALAYFHIADARPEQGS